MRCECKVTLWLSIAAQCWRGRGRKISKIVWKKNTISNEHPVGAARIQRRDQTNWHSEQNLWSKSGRWWWMIFLFHTTGIDIYRTGDAMQKNWLNTPVIGHIRIDVTLKLSFFVFKYLIFCNKIRELISNWRCILSKDHLKLSDLFTYS